MVDYPYVVKVRWNFLLMDMDPFNFNIQIILVCTSANATEDGAATRTEADQSQKPNKENITVLLANAGHTLDGADAELVLNPLRLAFETKNLKILEPALDCLHVCACFFDSTQ